MCVGSLLAVSDSQAGWLKRWIYTGLPGSSITNLHGTNALGQVAFPDLPATVDTIPAQPLSGPFTAETQTSFTNDYGSWVPGYLEPPQTGEYVFGIYGDETAELWLTSDPAVPADASRKRLIARVPARTHRRDWNVFPEQRSEPIRLEQGKIYYLEILHKEASPTYANLTAQGLQLIDQALGWAFNRELAAGGGGQPELVTTAINNGQFTLTWRNGSLESTTNLTPPVTWQDLGTSGTFTEPSGSGTKFFRVKQ